MGLKEGLLALTEIESSLEYKSEEKTSIGSALPLYTLSPSILLLQLLSPIPIDFSSFYYDISIIK